MLEGGDNMSEKQKKLVEDILSAGEKLPEERQYTLLGVAIGMGLETVHKEPLEGKSA